MRRLLVYLWGLAWLLSLALAAVRCQGQELPHIPQCWTDKPHLVTVRIKSHGGSGTVIATETGRSWVLSCAHMFEGYRDRKGVWHSAEELRAKTIYIDGPRQPFAATHTSKRPLKLLAWDYKADLSLIEIAAGPFYYMPVAKEAKPGQLLSCGFDSQEWPITVAWANVIGSGWDVIYTKEKPVPGRSGGGLINPRNKTLVGTCIGFEDIPRGRGIYTSHQAIVDFLERNAAHFAPADNSGGSVRIQIEQHWQPQLDPRHGYALPGLAPHLDPLCPT